MRLIAIILIILSIPAAAQHEVWTADGRRIRGNARRNGKAALVDTQTKLIYLSPAIVTKRKKASADEKLPEYHFNTDLVRRPKKGKVGLVAKDWGRQTPFDANGKASRTLTDFKLGEITFDVVIAKVTPVTYVTRGVQYDFVVSFPVGGVRSQAQRLILETVKPNEKKTVLKALRFFRLAGWHNAAQSVISGLPQKALQDKDFIAERRRLASAPVENLLDRLEQMQAFPNWEQMVRRQIAQAEAGKIELTDQTKKRIERMKKRLEQTKQEVEERKRVAARIRELLSAGGVKIDGLSGEQLLRVGRFADRDDLFTPKVLPDVLPTMLELWAESLTKASAEEMREAGKLAKAVSGYFVKGEEDQLDKAARMLQASKLPLAAKLSIFRLARAFPRELPQNWIKTEYIHPRSRKKFHYHVQVPAGYDPTRPTPVMLSLHGQITKANVMRMWWGAIAQREGFILISPEYIYDREWGYKCSQEEHEAILGALWHACGYLNIDRNRVFLQGHSQGGHASWELGGAHAGEFAGVIPIIGSLPHREWHQNYVDTAVYAIDGSNDGGAPAYNRKSMAILSAMKVDATYVEYKDRGHEGFTEEYPNVARWIRAHRRDPSPQTIHLTASRDCDRRRAWAEIHIAKPRLTERTRLRPMPEISGSCKGNTFSVKTRNVERISVYLMPDLIDFTKTVRVTVNGRPRFREKVKLDWRLALESSYERRDRMQIFCGVINLSAK